MFKQIFSTTAVKLLNAIGLLLMVVISTNVLGKENYGEISLFLLNVSVVMLFTDFVAGSSIVYYSSKIPTQKLMAIAYAWVVLLLLFVFGVVRGIALFWEFEFLKNKGLMQWQLLGALCVSVSTLHTNYLVGKQKLEDYNITILLQIFTLFIGLLIGFFYLKIQSTTVYFASYCISYAVAWAYSFFKIRRNTGEMVEEVLHKTYFLYFKSLFLFGVKAQLANSFQLINRRLSYYVIQSVLGIGSLGIFSVGVQLSEGLKILGQSVALVQFSHLSNTNDMELKRMHTLKLLKLNIILTSFGIGVLLCIPTSAYTFVFGQEFYEVKDVMWSLTLGIIALAGSQTLSSFFSGSGNPKNNMIGSAIGVMVTLIVIYPLINGYGLMGAGLCISIAFISSFIFQITQFNKITRSYFSDYLIKKRELTEILMEINTLLRRY